MAWMTTAVSRNAKTGPMPVTTSVKESCPAVCPFKGNGCYAESGPLRRLWDRLSTTPVGETFPNGPSGKVMVQGLAELLAFIGKRCAGVLWRHNQAGDLSHSKGWIDAIQLGQIVAAAVNALSRPFTYTHHAVLGNSPMAKHNRGAIWAANLAGFTINLSGNNVAHADKLFALKIAPVVMVVNSEVTEDFTTPDGNRVVICPATIKEGVTCMACGMCQDGRRTFGIAFPAHGTQVRKANEVAQ